MNYDDTPTSHEMLTAPELGVLHALDAVLIMAQRALIAAHPEIEHEDLLPIAPQLTPEAWIADAIGTHITGLQYALARYRALVRRRTALRPNEFDDF